MDSLITHCALLEIFYHWEEGFGVPEGLELAQVVVAWVVGERVGVVVAGRAK
eukprot:gene32-160_t